MVNRGVFFRSPINLKKSSHNIFNDLTKDDEAALLSRQKTQKSLTKLHKWFVFTQSVPASKYDTPYLL